MRLFFVNHLLKRDNKNKLYSNFFKAYIILIIVFVVLGTFIYQRAFKSLEEVTKQNTSTSLNHVREIIDNRFNEIDKISYQIATNPFVEKNINKSELIKGDAAFDGVELSKNLFNYKLTNNIIDNYYVYLKESDVVVSPETLYPFQRFAKFKLDDLTLDNMKIARFKEQMMVLDNHSGITLFEKENKENGLNEKLIVHLKSIGRFYDPKGVVWIELNQEILKEMFTGINIGNEGFYYILDNKDNIVVEGGKSPNQELLGALDKSKDFYSQKVGNTQMFISVLSSNNNQWVYVIGQPVDVVMHSLWGVRQIILLSFIGTLLVGVILAVYLAYKNTIPVKQILLDRDDLREKMEEELSFARVAFKERLLNGHYNDTKEVIQRMQMLKLSQTGKCFNVLILKYNHGSKEEIDTYNAYKDKISITTAIQEINQENVLVHDVDIDKIAIIMFLNDRGKDACTNEVNTVIDSYQYKLKQYNVKSFYFTVGYFVENIDEVSFSFKKAMQALHYLDWQFTERIVWAEDLDSKIDQNNHYYPTDLEVKIINLTRTGDILGVNKILDQLYIKNFVEKQLSPEIVEILISELYGTLLEIMEQCVIEDNNILQKSKEILSLIKVEPHYKIVEMTFNLIQECTKYVSKKREDKNDKIIKNAIQYIEEHFDEEQLGLSCLSEVVNISEVYLSQLFKASTGQNISQYIQNLRMSKVESLLKNTNLSIRDISKMNGYASLNTFGKAFKRIYGVNATEYRKTNKK